MFSLLSTCSFLVLSLMKKWSTYSSWSWVRTISGLLIYPLLQVLHRKLGDHQLWETSEQRSHLNAVDQERGQAHELLQASDEFLQSRILVEQPRLHHCQNEHLHHEEDSRCAQEPLQLHQKVLYPHGPSFQI